MDKSFLKIAGIIGCLGCTLLALGTAVLLASFMNGLLALVLSGLFFSILFFCFFSALYNRGVEIRTEAFYEESVNDFSDAKFDEKDDCYEDLLGNKKEGD